MLSDLRVPRPALRQASLGLVAAGLALGLTACSTSVTAGPATVDGTAPPAATPSPVSTAEVLFAPGDPQRGIAPDEKLTVLAVGGRLTTVAVTGADGTTVRGAVGPDGTTWTSVAGQRLAFGARYDAVATAVDPAGVATTQRSSFQVRAADRLTPSIANVEGSTVGVGMPVIVRFNRTPSDPAAVERTLTVRTSPAVDGAWAWVSPREVHWRPRTYWTPGTEVTVRAALEDVPVGDDQWGSRTVQETFRIGSSLVLRVGVDTYRMEVVRDGQVIRTIPITTGKAGFLTRNGVKVIMSKERSRVMDSATLDIPSGSPDAYRLRVDYAMRLTNSGEFIHAAPWSVSSQGRRNVSHGCTDMSTANAAWLYSIAKPGDVVEYTGSRRPMTLTNGYGDWNASWSRWTSLSALA